MSETLRLLGTSQAITHLRRQIERVAPTPLPILLRGETGTGKEVAARLIHQASGRTGPFIPIDCAALSPTLVESELFGHEKGSFTGANQRREGLVHTAREGTFFLDEIGELPMDVQTRLLRLLEQSTYRPVGAEYELKANIRIVAATWRDLAERVQESQFRRDLYHRLSVVEMVLPPLRDRAEDIEMLLLRFIEEAAAEMNRQTPTLHPQTHKYLLNWPWPGNVRELRNVASYLCAMCSKPVVHLTDLPTHLRRDHPTTTSSSSNAPDLHLDLPYMEARRIWLNEFQVRYIEALLEAHNGNVSATARAAGMDRRSIQRIMTRNGLTSKRD
ncbi:MAG: sigma-54-dependent Fis family transcriptional regulator [Proteobacteria bacterium]|jgi:two-component system, NtrC family, response regulator AtoC|nr:sigma-54-dependent Fis family transcriptional regulator [Pseudomonadota bacterium]